jgi:hypothetical protein
MHITFTKGDIFLFEGEAGPNDFLKFSLHLEENTTFDHYRDQRFNAVEEIIPLYTENYKTLMNTNCKFTDFWFVL